ncbi:MAG: tetratricopeptide repeat protein [Acidobacteriota bacterium]
MTRKQATLSIGGAVFGFTVGFLLAYALMGGGGVVRPPGSAAGPGRALQNAAPPPRETAQGDPQGDAHQNVMELLADLKGRLEKSPDDLPTLLELANLYLRAGMSEPALEYLRHGQEVDPGNFQVRLFTAMALDESGDDDGARKIIDALIATAPERWEPYYLLATHMIHQDDAEGARHALGRLEDLNPDLEVLPDLRREIQRMKSGPADAGAPEG